MTVHHRRAAHCRWPHLHGRGRLRVRAARLSRRLRRRQRQGTVALVDGARRSRPSRFEQPELAMAAKTWGKDWWKQGGGGTPWDGITYDPVTGYVYIGTGNGADWPAEDPLARRRRQPLYRLDRGLRCEDRQVRLALPGDAVRELRFRQHGTAHHGRPRHQWREDVMWSCMRRRTACSMCSMPGSGKALSADLFVPSVNWMTGFDKNCRPILNPEANYGKTGKGCICRRLPVACLESDGLQPGHGTGVHPDQLRQLPAMWPRRARRWATSCCPSTSPSGPTVRRRRCRRPALLPAGLGSGEEEGGLDPAPGHGRARAP